MNKVIIAVVVVVIGVGAGWYFFRGKGGMVKVPDTKTVQTDLVVTETPIETPAMTSEGKIVVKYTDNGFSPKSITVKKGTTVVFTNESSAGMWVASDVHPTHQLLPGFDERASVQNGGSYEYTFVKVGTWTLHNHVMPSQRGTVIVTE